jgi:hypothetical protein
MTVVKGSDSSGQDAVQNKEGAKDRPADVTTTDGENNTTSTADDISAAGPEASATPTGTTTKDDTKTSDSTVAEDKKSDDNDAKADAAGDKRRPVNDKKQSGTTRSTRKPTPAPMRKYTVKHKKSAVLTSCSIPRPRTRWCVIVYACATRYGHYSSLS